MRSGLIFIGLTWAAGIVAGIVEARSPGLIPLPVPTFTSALIVGLLVDLALRAPAAERRGMQPVTTNERAFGVIGAALIGLGAGALASG